VEKVEELGPWMEVEGKGRRATIGSDRLKSIVTRECVCLFVYMCKCAFVDT